MGLDIKLERPPDMDEKMIEINNTKIMSTIKVSFQYLAITLVLSRLTLSFILSSSRFFLSHTVFSHTQDFSVYGFCLFMVSFQC